MTAYTTITPALVAVGAKPFATTIQALRDNPIAIAEGDVLAPLQSAGWHPYNKTMNNGAETGAIWSFANDGAVATITTPDFEDGWDYAISFNRVFSNNVTGSQVQLNLFRETTGAYAGVANIGAQVSTTLNINGRLYLENMRKVRNGHSAWGFLSTGTVANAVATAPSPSGHEVRHATAQKILRAQFSIASGVSFAGADAAIYLLRRRSTDV